MFFLNLFMWTHPKQEKLGQNKLVVLVHAIEGFSGDGQYCRVDKVTARSSADGWFYHVSKFDLTYVSGVRVIGSPQSE